MAGRGNSTGLDRRQRVFIWLTALFVAALVTGDFIGGKFWVLAGHNLSAGIIPFPLTFVLTDVVNEFYGTQGARRLTFVGLGAAIFVWAVITLALHLPPSPQSPIPDPVFQAAFGTSAVFAVGAVYGLASSAAVLSLRSVRAVRWRGEDEPPVSASSPPREGRRRRLAAPPP